MVQSLYFVANQPVLCGCGASCYKMEGLDSNPLLCRSFVVVRRVLAQAIKWPICGFLRFAAKIFGLLNLRFSAVSCALQMLEFPGEGVNLRKSAVFCENLLFGLSLSPYVRHLKLGQKVSESVGLAPLQKIVGDFCCIKFGGFCRGFSWRIFLGTFSHKNEEKKSGDKIRWLKN